MTSPAQTRWLHTFLITGEMLVLGWLVATEDLSRIGLLLAGVIGAIGLVAIVHSRFPLGALGVLVASAAMPRFAGTLLGLHVRAFFDSIGLVVQMVSFQTRRCSH